MGLTRALIHPNTFYCLGAARIKPVSANECARVQVTWHTIGGSVTNILPGSFRRDRGQCRLFPLFCAPLLLLYAVNLGLGIVLRLLGCHAATKIVGGCHCCVRGRRSCGHAMRRGVDGHHTSSSCAMKAPGILRTKYWALLLFSAPQNPYQTRCAANL